MKQKVRMNINWEAVLNKTCKATAIVAGVTTACAITNSVWKPNTVFGKIVDCIVTGITGSAIGCGYAYVLDKVWGTNCFKFTDDIVTWEVETEIVDVDSEVFNY